MRADGKIQFLYYIVFGYHSLPSDFFPVNDIDARCHSLFQRAVFHLFTGSHLASHQVVNASVANNLASTVGRQFLILFIVIVIEADWDMLKVTCS